MSQQKVKDTLGKKVIDSNARDVGKISDISYDSTSWTVTSFHLKIPGQVCVELELSKFKLGSKTALLTPDMIQQIGDNVQLVSPIAEVVSQAEIM